MEPIVITLLIPSLSWHASSGLGILALFQNTHTTHARKLPFVRAFANSFSQTPRLLQKWATWMQICVCVQHVLCEQARHVRVETTAALSISWSWSACSVKTRNGRHIAARSSVTIVRTLAFQSLTGTDTQEVKCWNLSLLLPNDTVLTLITNQT